MTWISWNTRKSLQYNSLSLKIMTWTSWNTRELLQYNSLLPKYSSNWDIHEKKKVYTVMINNFTNINKTNNHLTPKKTTTCDIGNVGLAAINLSSTATSSNHNTLYSGYSVLIGYSIVREQNRSQRFYGHQAM